VIIEAPFSMAGCPASTSCLLQLRSGAGTSPGRRRLTASLNLLSQALRATRQPSKIGSKARLIRVERPVLVRKSWLRSVVDQHRGVCIETRQDFRKVERAIEQHLLGDALAGLVCCRPDNGGLKPRGLSEKKRSSPRASRVMAMRGGDGGTLPSIS